MSRRLDLCIPALALLIAAGVSPTAWAAFGFEQVAARAQQLAAQPYQPAPTVKAEALRALDYDGYRDIRFRPERALWRAERLPFEVQFFHPGLYFQQTVRVHEITGGTAREIRFDPADFDYGANRVDPAQLRDIGFAGFRVHTALNTPTYKDEVLVFLGASYLRALGADQGYGLSARGLAVDTAAASGEEFPRFTEFWIERPAAAASTLVIHALLDSPSVAGAYRFELRPGANTVLDVTARLYARRGAARFGLAPLTSMYLFGENQRARQEDYRPEVHDSDGLSIHAADGEWIWRPLANPRQLTVSSFALADPRGFGLMQRDRDFASYQDLEARYERRPSAWVEPVGNWGPGRVELVLIPTPDETHDNVVASWVPDRMPAPGAPFDLAYRLHWQGREQSLPPGGWVVQTRRGHGYRKTPDDTLKLIVEFDGPALRALPPQAEVAGRVTAVANAEIVESNAWRNEATGAWRLALRLRQLDTAQPAELRAFLHTDSQTLSETWSYLLPPE